MLVPPHVDVLETATSWCTDYGRPPTTNTCYTQYARPIDFCTPNLLDHQIQIYPISCTTDGWYLQYVSVPTLDIPTMLRPRNLEKTYVRPPNPNVPGTLDCQILTSRWAQPQTLVTPNMLDQWILTQNFKICNHWDHQCLIYPPRLDYLILRYPLQSATIACYTQYARSMKLDASRSARPTMLVIPNILHRLCLDYL